METLYFTYPAKRMCRSLTEIIQTAQEPIKMCKVSCHIITSIKKYHNVSITPNEQLSGTIITLIFISHGRQFPRGPTHIF